MNKDIVISLQGGAVTALLFPALPDNEQIGLFIGIATCLFIFLLFLEDLHDKWYRQQVKRVKSIRKMKKMLRDLGQLELKVKEAQNDNR